MIPLQLTLKNFLSYRQITLDFHGLHTACICGANGAGKSSLLEAITWVIWGQTRTATEDDVIHTGEKDVRVDFEFISNYNTYRVIRSRQRGKSSGLEFQIQTESGKFRSLSAKGLRATQQQIISALKLDYDTFINSAYLRQGRADEFMLRKPSERKKVLADLLKLEQYENLAQKAKDLAKKFKVQYEELEQYLEPLATKIAQKDYFLKRKSSVTAEIKQLESSQTEEQENLRALQVIQHQRDTWEKQISWQETQYHNLEQDCERLEQEYSELKNQTANLENLINQEPEIQAEYQNLLKLQRTEENFAAKFQAYQDAQQKYQELSQEIERRNNRLKIAINSQQSSIESLAQQEKEINETLKSAPEIEVALTKLEQHRQYLQSLDQLQLKVTPLLQQRQNLQTELEKVEAKLTAKLEELRSKQTEFSQKIAAIPQKRQELMAVDTQLEELDKKKNYQIRITEKSREKERIKERLQENQRNCQQQLQELQQKLQMLQTPEASCPLCEQELDHNHRHRVVEKTETQQQKIEEQIWVIQEEITIVEREFRKLQQESLEIKEKLENYDHLQQQFGQLEAQLEATAGINQELQQINQKIEEIEKSLIIGNYANELQTELKQLDEQIKQLNYNEQNHALARGEEKKWRWAEIQQAKIEDARRNLASIRQKKPQLIKNITNLQAELEQLHENSPIQQEINKLKEEIQEINYDRLVHNQLISSLRQAQKWQLSYQQLQQAKAQYPQQKKRLQELEKKQELREQDKKEIQNQLEYLISQRENIQDNRNEINLLEQKIQEKRKQLDELIKQQGSLEQSLKQIESFQQEYENTNQRLAALKKQYRIHEELSKAFGKNGIQALMIENILPDLEAQTNQILARLTGNQFHVQFLTQKSGKNTSRKKSSTAKLIDTLDILIADARGTRAYETYSGGEAFRINFSIRLALARLLAQRAGTSLQMLVVDEGFGTQDTEG